MFNFEHLTTAFLRFIAIYSDKFPEQTPHLVKHTETVRTLDASQVSRTAWMTYDRQVRMDRQVQSENIRTEVNMTEYCTMIL